MYVTKTNFIFIVGGDSGAWVIDNKDGRVCGHVLAWCERNAMAYICPMDVLLEDMKHTLKAKRVCLPGSVEDQTDRSMTEVSQSLSAGRLIEAGPTHSTNITHLNELSLNEPHASSSSSSPSLSRGVQRIHPAGRMDPIRITQ